MAISPKIASHYATFISLAMLLPFFLFASPALPVKTDYAIFLFDNGDKNLIASMLKYAEQNDKERLRDLNFRIIFMGASIDSMDKEPFSHFPEKLLHYKQLGIKETIDQNWKRDKKLTPESMSELTKNLVVQKKVWVGVSCSIFEQLLQHYQTQSKVETLAIRDNPSPFGDTDYFKIADEVQKAASKIAVPSQAVSKEWQFPDKKIVLIGHAPMEEWLEEAQHIDKETIIRRLGLNPKLPIIVYAGSYGDNYQNSFEQFLYILPHQMQTLVVPHPRFKGIVEERLVSEFSQLKIVGEFIEDPLRKIRTVEALSIADVVVTSDATSTIVFQANALGKKVVYVNAAPSEVSIKFCDQKLIYKVSNKEQFLKIVDESKLGEDVFKLLGIPRQGAKLLWNELTAVRNFQ